MTIAGLLSLLALAGCDWKEREARQRQEELDRTFTATSYNYTRYILHQIAFKDSALPFKIDNAPSGGSTYRVNGSEETLDNGEKITRSASTCCFMWSGPLDKPGRVRLVWLVIHNLGYYDAEPEGYEAPSRNNPRGGRWCQAIVDIRPAAGPDRPDMVAFHFLADGSVQAQLANEMTAKPLASSEVKRHSAPMPEGQVCRQEIDNPWYGIPPKPHRE